MNTKINDTVFNSFPQLETERLLLTSFELSDVEMVFECRSNLQVMKFMGKPPHQSTDEAKKYVEGMIEGFKNKKGISWAIVDKTTNKRIGYVALWRLIRRHIRAEIGYWMHPDYWGKGLMSEAIEKVIEFGFKELQVHSIEGCTEPNNKASRAVLENAGFVLEAYFKENFFNDGAFEDSVIYSLLEGKGS